VNEGFFFRQFVHLEHLILELPSDYLRRINFSVMNQLQTLEITTELSSNSFDHTYEPCYSELSGVSIGNELEGVNYCRGLDYSQLQLPTSHVLQHLKIVYKVKKRKLAGQQNLAVMNYNHSISSWKPRPVIYHSLVPGYDHSELQTFSPGINAQLSESTHAQGGVMPSAGKHASSAAPQNLPRVRNISVFVDEVHKAIDQSSLQGQTLIGPAAGAHQRFLNPQSINVAIPSPNFSYGAFEHVPAGGTALMTESQLHQHQRQNHNVLTSTNCGESLMPSIRRWHAASFDEELLRANGAVHGYSLIRLQRRPDTYSPQEQPANTTVSIYFKKLQLSFNLKMIYSI
jgi:hypothetical protein